MILSTPIISNGLHVDNADGWIMMIWWFVFAQATIKLYVLTAMFEILDKLLISFGQDTLDSLYWSAKRNMRKRLVLASHSGPF